MSDAFTSSDSAGQAAAGVDVAAAISSGSTGSLYADLGTDGVVNVAANGLDTTNPFSASCPTDIDVGQFRGVTLTIPMSKTCTGLELAGQLIVAMAALAGLMYAFRS